MESRTSFFLTHVVAIVFAPLIKMNEIITYFHDISIQAETKTHMSDRLRNFYETVGKSKQKGAPEKTFFFLAAVLFLGHVITKNKIRPLLNKIGAIQRTKRLESEKDVMKLLRALNKRSKYLLNMHVILASFYTLLHDDVSFHWNKEID